MEHLSVRDLARLSERRVVDVREPDEYAAGHVPGAVNIPLGQLIPRIAEIPSAVQVQVICQSGGRSAQGTRAILEAGRDAVNVDGGTAAWIAAGQPVEH